MRGAVGIVLALTIVGCSGSSASSTAADAEAPDAADASDATSPDAHSVDAASYDASAIDAGTTEIVIDAGSLPISDGALVRCGPDYNGVVVFYAATGDPMPTETGLLPCASPVVIVPVQPSTTYQLDVYLQQGASLVAQATCSATTRAGEAVAPTCPPFM